jgi:hypothetical protein
VAQLAGNDKLVLPVPCFNVINGGSHAGNKLAFQEYFIIPTGAKSFKHAMQIGSECYHNLKSIIKKKFGGDATLIGDEGGFAPPCDARQGVELIMEAIKKAGYEAECQVGMDVAASEFKVEGEDCYDLGTWYPEAEKTPELKMTGKALGEFYAKLAKDFPIMTIEDPFDQDDWASWSEMTKNLNVDGSCMKGGWLTPSAHSLTRLTADSSRSLSLPPTSSRSDTDRHTHARTQAATCARAHHTSTHPSTHRAAPHPTSPRQARARSWATTSP